jgi:hypothetical protein
MTAAYTVEYDSRRRRGVVVVAQGALQASVDFAGEPGGPEEQAALKEARHLLITESSTADRKKRSD